jgi:hypothetical protein
MYIMYINARNGKIWSAGCPELWSLKWRFWMNRIPKLCQTSSTAHITLLLFILVILHCCHYLRQPLLLTLYYSYFYCLNDTIATNWHNNYCLNNTVLTAWHTLNCLQCNILIVWKPSTGSTAIVILLLLKLRHCYYVKHPLLLALNCKNKQYRYAHHQC